MQKTNHEDSAYLTLYDHISGYWRTQAIYVAAKLNIADYLSQSPKNPADLARLTNTQVDPLCRLLRALASIGLMQEDAQGVFHLTAQGKLLCPNVVGSCYATALLCGDLYNKPWQGLLQSIEQGDAAFDRIMQDDFFSYLKKHPELSEIFNQCMYEKTWYAINSIMQIYDFSNCNIIADVGGGKGYFLARILRDYPNLRGILYDLPQVIEEVQTEFPAEVKPRCQFMTGNFFEKIPVVDTLIMKSIIHDWPDEKALTILRHCHQSLPMQGKLLLVERVIARDNKFDEGKWMDLHMLVLLNSRERSAQEFHDLLGQANFTITQIVPSSSGFSVIEAQPNK